MKPETARRQIVDYTKQEMILHGVSRLTMDLIAQGMGMSKRTLYQLFPSKVCLVRICLAEKRRVFLYGDSFPYDGCLHIADTLSGQHIVV